MTIALAASIINPQVNIFALSGRLAVETEGKIQAQLLEVIKQSPRGLILDLASVAFVSSAGLRMLILVYKNAATSGIKLAMIRPQPEIFKLLKLDASTPEKGVENLVRAVAELKKTLGVPASLREAGVTEADFKAKLRFMAEAAFDDQCVGANPSYPLVDDLVKVLEEAYG